MKVEIKTDPSIDEPKIIVVTNQITDDIHKLVKKLSVDNSPIITGYIDETLHILPQEDIINIYALNGKVFANTKQHEYIIKARLYELENRLDSHSFVRISNSEIINLKLVKSFDLSFTGTICVQLENGIVTYVSRRYVSKIKKVLGI